MYGKDLLEGSEAQTGWRWRGGVNRASRSFKQPCLPFSVWHCNKAVVRHCNAIQHLQQRGIACFMALYERKARLEFFRYISKGEISTYRQNVNSSNCSRAASKQSKLVRLNVVGYRQYFRVGNRCESLASWRLCKVEAYRARAKATASTSNNEGKALRKAEKGKGALKTQLSVHRISEACFISVQRIRGILCLSVYRIYVSYFPSFPYPYIEHLLDIPLYTAFVKGEYRRVAS